MPDGSEMHLSAAAAAAAAITASEGCDLLLLCKHHCTYEYMLQKERYKFEK